VTTTRYTLDGERFDTLEGFYEEFGRVVLDGREWGRNLDAFHDVLGGGFGTPAGGFTLRWLNHQTSRERLGYPETLRQLQRRRERADPSNHAAIDADIARAQAGEGPTVYDWLLAILRWHGPSGPDAEDGVRLELV
jgi:RNAse (barnase) inhibitor barstar